ncbi:hypothetical protein [Enterococcus rotai]|uniref:hypothetical protein n=1 Tax=Enterococcus rotai TaxID=118060 RepID=UPI0032B32F40
MKDMLMIIYNQLLTNAVVKDKVTSDRIKFYDYPETGDVDNPFIVISPLGVPSGSVIGSDKELSLRFSYQIDVQGKDRLAVKQIQNAVKITMGNLRYVQLPEGIDTYFNETKRFLDARRYRKNTELYDTDY